MGTPPEFPPPFVTERVRRLGYGSGPWQREQFVELWQAPMADKFILEGKAAGWLVSPLRGTYFVPAAQDLTIVSWLPEPLRSEFLIARTLATADIRFWCLSSWCRSRGLEFGYPLFVTDLSTKPRYTVGPNLDRRKLQEEAKEAAARTPNLPFLESLLILPTMPPTVPSSTPLFFLAEESPEAEQRRKTLMLVGQATAGLVGLVVWAATKKFPEKVADSFADMDEQLANGRAIPYSLGPEIPDEAWITALLASIGTARIEEFVSKRVRNVGTQEQAAIQRWAGMAGPPQPNEGWRTTLQEGPFPYLLVPKLLWAEMGADQAARRFRMLQKLGVSDAGR